MKIAQTRDELEQHLKEQFQFLVRSMNSYDNGFEAEAKRLAHIIRVLVHDTRNSYSLLSQIGLKTTLDYFDYTGPRDVNKTVIFNGVGIKFTEFGIKYFARTDQPEYKSNFTDWWDGVVMCNSVQNIVATRKSTILSVANKDGGSHVDTELETEYVEFSRNNSMGWEVPGDDGAEKIIENSPHLVIVRQVAQEMFLTLQEQTDVTK